MKWATLTPENAQLVSQVGVNGHNGARVLIAAAMVRKIDYDHVQMNRVLLKDDLMGINARAMLLKSQFAMKANARRDLEWSLKLQKSSRTT